MKEVGNAALIRDLNTNKLLTALKKSQPVSRVELARTTGLSFPTVSRIVKRLSRNEFIVEHSDGLSTGGRRPTLLRLNPEAGYVVGVEVDVPETVVAILNLNGQIRSSKVLDTHPKQGPDDFVEKLGETIQQLISEKGSYMGNVMGIGVAVPGNIDPRRGTLVYSANLGWRNVHLKEMIAEKTELDTLLESDAHCMAIGEHFFGGAREFDNLAWVYVGGGIGVGLVHNGISFRGVYGSAGEVGHIPVLRDGPPCVCGRKGCLETMVATPGILSRLIEAVAEGKESTLSDFVRKMPNDLRIRHVFEAAEQGDKLASALVEDTAYYLAVGLSMISNLLDPGLIVVGGPVIDSGGDGFFESVVQLAAEDILPDRVERLKVKRSALGEHVGVMGAASLVFQEKFRSPVMTM